MAMSGGIWARTKEAFTGRAIPRALLNARITHARLAPKPYSLAHKLTYVYAPLSALEALPRPLLSRNGFNLFALNDRDYGTKGSPEPLSRWIDRAFESAGRTMPDGDINLLTLPRVLGFGFNPVSFWLCHDKQGTLRAMLAEVNNTFGERHCYLCMKPDGSPLTVADEIEAEKIFHVSPFMPVDGTYRFRIHETDERLAVQVDLFRDGRRVFTSAIAGRLAPLTSWALLKSFLAHPFPSLQVIVLIHYHAAHLFVRGLRVFSKPAPPRDLITTSSAAVQVTRAAPTFTTEPT